ncbi:tryptophan--tRNA ligase [Mediannikoviicoccus vaginalis]|uniref:tryptophan--tRNA ligase n=1 Tax=Mediannikoviicoccus vaginalis TaxID=2899727 RepID=UPI0021067FC1|nr:tryptophan--tRNA ligase [Mediannikoviicoccus vaginalis]
MMNKKVVLSGVQPSGSLTIGNYLGAIQNFSRLQEDYECIYAIADLHSITVPQVAKDLRRRTYEVLALYMACNVDPEKSTIFVQSHVPQHLELSWVLSSISYMGQLSRMTQFKDKAKKSEENLNAALFTYPVLMAADILLYQTDFVPVGEDQRQHLELARDLAIRFNSKYSDTFKVPDNLIRKETGKIYSLKDPSVKMSKSSEDENSYILMLDDPKTIERKIKRAVTDSDANFCYSDDQPGLKNLINIYQAFSNESVEDIVKQYEGESYGPFKNDLAELIIESLRPIQEEYNRLINDKAYLEEVMAKGASKASYLANKTLRKVYRKVGFVQI